MTSKRDHYTPRLFRKKMPVQAYQYDGREPLIIRTLEGDMIAQPGDWIITGIHGERYPCKPDIFVATYEELAESQLERRD